MDKNPQEFKEIKRSDIENPLTVAFPHWTHTFSLALGKLDLV
jgi:hypothetical protein